MSDIRLTPRQQQIVHLLRHHGPLTLGGLAEHLGRSRSTVSHHLNRLVAFRVVERDGRWVRLPARGVETVTPTGGAL